MALALARLLDLSQGLIGLAARPLDPVLPRASLEWIGERHDVCQRRRLALSGDCERRRRLAETKRGYRANRERRLTVGMTVGEDRRRKPWVLAVQRHGRKATRELVLEPVGTGRGDQQAAILPQDSMKLVQQFRALLLAVDRLEANGYVE